MDKIHKNGVSVSNDSLYKKGPAPQS